MSKRRNYLPEFEAPEKKLCIEQELKIKALIKNQTNVNINLKMELQKEKIFNSTKELNLLCSLPSGISTLKHVQDSNLRQIEIEKLQKLGLTQTDIDFYFEYVKNGMEFLKSKYHNCKEEYLGKRIENLLRLIDHSKKKQPNMDCIPSIQHPMDELKHIHTKLFGLDATNNEYVNIEQLRRKARKIQNRVDKSVSQSIPAESLFLPEYNINTQWDQADAPKYVQPKIQTVRKDAHTCKEHNKYTIANGKIVKLNEIKEIKDFKMEISDRLNVDQIKKLPPFSNYVPGVPSKILYVKNLPKQISKSDLQTIFKDCDILEFKLMQGKMRGQAFLTFIDEKSAEKCLLHKNGLIINSKPIIIQFGHNKS